MKALKKEYRTQLKGILKNITSRERSKREEALGNSLLFTFKCCSFTIQEKFRIGGYAPLDDEVDWMRKLAEFKKQFCFPGFRDNRMSFYQSSFDELIETQEFGVKVKTPNIKMKEFIPDVLIIPGLGFTKDGRRLGRGKGFYDKYLENYTGIKIGVGLNEQIIEDLPVEKHDVNMDFVVSDLHVYKAGKMVFDSTK